MRKIFLALTGALALSAAAASARAQATVLLAGGPEEVALRAVAELYNGTAADNDKVSLIFFNRDGFFEQACRLIWPPAPRSSTSTWSPPTPSAVTPRSWIPSPSRPNSLGALGDKVLATMQFDGKQYGVPTDLSLHFMYFRQDLIDQLKSDPAWKAREPHAGEVGRGPRAQGSRPVDMAGLDGRPPTSSRKASTPTARRATAPCCR